MKPKPINEIRPKGRSVFGYGRRELKILCERERKKKNLKKRKKIVFFNLRVILTITHITSKIL